MPSVEAYGLWTDRRPALVPDFVRRIPSCEGGSLAIFDADGTLWRDDVADDFTLWMIRSGHVPGDLWPEYLRIYRGDAPAGCRFLLRLYEGLTMPELHARIDEYWLHHANRTWVPEVVESVHHLAGRGCPIWVITGSPTDFMLPLKRMLPVAEVLGMDFEVGPDGRITGRHEGISCAGTGKADKVRAASGGRPVVFAAGNGNLDGPMMEMAEQAWAVYPNPEFERFARSRGWPVLPRPADFVEEDKLA